MKTICILSGGMDSTTLLHDHLRQGHELRALSFDYGQRHKKELGFAKKTCRKLGIDHHIVDLTTITGLISNSALTGNKKIPHGHYAAASMKQTVVPNRNMIMLSVAIGYAENIGFDSVAIANHAGDHAIYPDCRTEFIKALSKASELGTYNKIKIYAPYSKLTKGQIAKIGLDLGIDYGRDTWSCYEGKDKPCGKCGTCVERIEALNEAGAIL